MSEASGYTTVIRCGHCGNTAPMRVIGHVTDIVTLEAETGESRDTGTVYEVSVCPSCEKPILRTGDWNDDVPSDWLPADVYPDVEGLEAREVFSQRSADMRFMRLAVAEAARSQPEPEKKAPPPLVGAVIARGGELIASAFRGEKKAGEHAEYTVLEGKCEKLALAGATVYTTLEPCTSRNHPKAPCVERLKSRRVARVVIGILDPNDDIRGRGILELRKAGIQVDLFPSDLMNQLEEMNREFISDQEKKSRGPAVRSEKPSTGAEDKWVNLSYLVESGISAKLEADGYATAWVSAEDESAYVDLKHWEYLLHPDGGAAPKKVKIRDPSAGGGYLVFLKKKR